MNALYELKVVSIPSDEDEEIENAVLYVTGDDEFTAVPGVLITGAGGDLNNPDNRYPLIIFEDGQGDYETTADWAPKSKQFPRYFKTDLRSKRIAIGAEFTVEYELPKGKGSSSDETPGSDATMVSKFKIIEVTPLAGSPQQTK